MQLLLWSYSFNPLQSNSLCTLSACGNDVCNCTQANFIIHFEYRIAGVKLSMSKQLKYFDVTQQDRWYLCRVAKIVIVVSTSCSDIQNADWILGAWSLPRVTQWRTLILHHSCTPMTMNITANVIRQWIVSNGCLVNIVYCVVHRSKSHVFVCFI